MQQSWPDAKEQLPQEMVSMVQVMKLDLHASEAEDVLTAALAKLHEQEARTAAEKVARLMQQYRARRLAVVGLQERSKPWPTDKSKNCSLAARSMRPIPNRRKCKPSSRQRFPNQRGNEERRAKVSFRARSTGDKSQQNRRRWILLDIACATAARKAERGKSGEASPSFSW